MPDDVEETLQKRWCQAFLAERDGDSILLRTPFIEPDGDELRIELSRVDGGWRLADRGHTTSHLLLDDFFFTTSRAERLARVVHGGGARLLDDTNIVLDMPDLPGAIEIADFIQVLAQVRALPVMERERRARRYVYSARARIRAWGNVESDWRATDRDPTAAFVVDERFPPLGPAGGRFEGLLVFVAGDGEKADRAANVVTQLHEWNIQTPTIAAVNSDVDPRALTRLASRVGSENVVSMSYGDWPVLHDALAHRGAPIGPLDLADESG